MKHLELKIPPLALTLLFAGGIWLLAGGWPVVELDKARWLGLALLAGGALTEFAGIRAFRRARTTMNPLDPAKATAVVVGGIYRYSRNPMYLGFLLVLAGWALWLGDGAGLLLLPLFVLYMNRFQIEPEERAMMELFGQEFADYRDRVRRWL